MTPRMDKNSDTQPMASSGWQRLSPWSVVFILVAGIVRFVRENIPLILGAGVGAAVFEQIGAVEIALVCGLLLALAGIISIVYYRRFRFRLDDGVLRVQRGLVERQELKLQAGRIQHISTRQPLYMRPLGLVRLSVDTPGSTAAEIELPGIRRDAAESLRTRLSEARQSEGHGDPEAGHEPGEPDENLELFRVTPRNLTLHGLASNYAYVMAAALSPFLHRIERFLAEHFTDLGLWERLATSVGSPGLAAALLVAGLLLFLVTISVIVSWLRFYGFTLARDNRRFTQRSGLLNRQEQLLSLSKLQAVEWVQTAMGRIVRRSHLVCRQIGAAAMAPESAGRTFLVPGLDGKAARRLSREFWPGINPDIVLRRVDPFYRRALLIRFSLLFSLPFGFLAATAAGPPGALGIVAVPLVIWPFVTQHWRVVGWATDRYYVYFRSGLVGRRIIMFPSNKVQRVELTQSWLQRRRSVATVRLVLSSGPVIIPFLRIADARFLVNLTLYRIESKDTNKYAPVSNHSAD